MSAVAWIVSTIANEAVLGSPANPKRKSHTAINKTPTDANYGYSSRVATSGANEGLPLTANGGSIIEGEPGVYKGEIWVIAASAIDLNFAEVSED